MAEEQPDSERDILEAELDPALDVDLSNATAARVARRLSREDLLDASDTEAAAKVLLPVFEASDRSRRRLVGEVLRLRALIVAAHNKGKRTMMREWPSGPPIRCYLCLRTESEMPHENDCKMLELEAEAGQ